jgi:RimJ/RimL family protein N-acetyltransferase
VSARAERRRVDGALVVELGLVALVLIAVAIAIVASFGPASVTVGGEEFDCGSAAQAKDWEAIRTAEARASVGQVDPAVAVACRDALDDTRSIRTAALVVATLASLLLAAMVTRRRIHERHQLEPLRERGLVRDRRELERVATLLRDPRVLRVNAALVARLETDRLLIRPARPADADAVREVTDDEVVQRNGWRPGAVDDLVDTVRAGGRIGLWVICDRTTDAVLGMIQVDHVREREGRCELGFSLGPRARGRGYGTEAVQAVAARLHAAGLDFVEVGCSADNFGVQRVMEKVGAEEIRQGVARLPDGTETQGVWYVLRGEPLESDP